MIKNVIYVEDGSVDVDELQESLGEDTKVIVYRQGARRPEIEQLAEPIKTDWDLALEKARDKVEKTREHFNKLYQMAKTNKVDKEIQTIYNILFEGIDF